MSLPSDAPLDVAIVGGGVSGTYSAWRLIEHNPNLRIALFEGSDRVGGRLLSVRPPGMASLTAELGGMFIPSLHTLASSLAEHLGLQLDVMPHGGLNRAYLRGMPLTAAAMRDPQQVPYRLVGGEQGRLPDELPAYALEQLIPALQSASGSERYSLLEDARVAGRPLRHWGFWNLLVQALSDDGYNFAREGTGDDYLVANWNAADIARQYYQLAGQFDLLHVREGYDAIPRTLAARFAERGGSIALRHRLIRFDRAVLPDGTLGVRLEFDCDSSGWGAAPARAPGVVYARRLILAMPRRSLELLEPSGALLRPDNQQIRDLIGAVTPLPMFKLFLCYERAWWRDLGITGGFSVTDMPLRACLYWGEDPESHNALLLASLSDMLAMGFWEGLRDARHQPLFSPSGEPPRWSDYSAPPTGAMVAEAQRQLALLHGQALPEPYAAVYRDWGEDPFGGAGNFWNVHVDSRRYAQRMLRPDPELPVFICGEAYSRTQGWVEGALETAEQMLRQQFGLDRPDWQIQEKELGH